MDKIFTFGDGYATGHLWPEWPQILEALVPNYQVINTAGIGAGAEYLVHQLVKQLDQMPESHVIFQWPVADRFDKIVEDQRWSDIIKNDPVYHFNTVPDDMHLWWLSSASQQKEIRTYHEFFVQPEQQRMRVEDYKTLVKNTLENIGCKLHYTSLVEEVNYSRQDRFQEIRQSEVQPSPPVHYYFLIEQILPNTDIKYDTDRAQKLEQLILNQKWVAYDPNRAGIWDSLTQTLNSL